jgi:molybdenum cofactor cytidylyltransferase
MMVSLQAGMAALPAHTAAFLLALGDQPQIQPDTVRRVMEAYQENRAGLVVPSHEMRRGHPWLVDRRFWPELGSQPPQTTLRDFLNRRQAEIRYVTVATPSILLDLDTPEDYQRYAPGS